MSKFDEDRDETREDKTRGSSVAVCVTLIICGTVLLLGSVAALCYERSALSSGGLMAMVAFFAGGAMIFLGFIMGSASEDPKPRDK